MAAGLELGRKGDTVSTPRNGVHRGVAVLDFFLRLIALVATLASAIAMGTTNESLPFFTQFIRFRAKYSDLPTFTFFVVANSIVSAYLVLSLALSIFHILRSHAHNTRVVLIFFDAKRLPGVNIRETIFANVIAAHAMLALLTAGASAAAAIVYLAHKGNVRTNWFAICQQFNSFCQRTSGCLVGSFGGVLVLVLLILMSAVSLSSRR